MQRAKTDYVFGRFQLEVDERRLLRDGQPFPLTPNAFNTLLALVQRAGHVVSKADLMSAIWPDGFVEESNLSFNISTLRKALADGQNGERYIETVPKLGYRFVMPVNTDSPVHPEVPPGKRSNLPAPLTTFIDRASEMAAVRARLLQSDVRLFTLVGPPGIGKTRLAIESASQWLDAFEDGVWWVELANLHDGALLPESVAKAIDMQEARGEPLHDTLMRKLRDKQLLLVLDNCEHLLDDCAPFVEKLLLACRRLKVLTTSREALGIIGEMLWPVQPLSLPARDLTSPAQLLEQSESVRLFCIRAEAVHPAFALTVQNASAVTHICRRLDGIPLAIELAAARVKHFPVEQIALRLDDRFSFLSSGLRTPLAWHRTLRATIDWSYSHLNETERNWFNRLSVFAGGCDIDSAQHVAGSDATTTFNVLARMADKSLLQVEHKNGQRRWRMLETIQEYALDTLRAQGANAEYSTRDRHLEYFLALAERPWPMLPDEQIAWLDRLEMDHGNFRAAMDWALAQQNSDMALRLVWALSQFWERRHHFREAREAMAKALANSRPTERTLARARMLSLSSLGWFNESYIEARPLLEEALQIGMEVGDRAFVAHSLFALGCNAFHRKDYTSELDYFERSLSVWQELGDQAGICRQMVYLSGGYYDTGDFERARVLLEEALQLADVIGAKTDKPMMMIWLGQTILRQGDTAKAVILLREGLVLNQAAGVPYALVYAIEPFMNLAMAQGQIKRAVLLLGAREAVIEAGELGSVGWGWPDTEGVIENARRRLDEETFAIVWAEGRAMTEEQMIQFALAS